jgi:hypothetical protein
MVVQHRLLAMEERLGEVQSRLGAIEERITELGDRPTASSGLDEQRWDGSAGLDRLDDPVGRS